MHWKDAHSREPWFNRSDLMVDASAVKQKVKNMPKRSKAMAHIPSHKHCRVCGIDISKSRRTGLQRRGMHQKYEKDEKNKGTNACVDAGFLRHLCLLNHPTGSRSIDVELSRTMPTFRQDKRVNNLRILHFTDNFQAKCIKSNVFQCRSSLADLRHR